MKVSYNNKTYDLDDLYEVLDNEDFTNAVEDDMNETFDPVKILSLEYSAGHALRVLDPVAFREVVLEEMNFAIEDLRIDLESKEVGETAYLRYTGEVTLMEE